MQYWAVGRALVSGPLRLPLILSLPPPTGSPANRNAICCVGGILFVFLEKNRHFANKVHVHVVREKMIICKNKLLATAAARLAPFLVISGKFNRINIL